ncbi:MAG TPA: ATP-dependent DNA helicase [Candidatus Angelobacter sp.]|nr:ATP-dependent DNA helicase [Candidatus Angelobacter sp.]
MARKFVPNAQQQQAIEHKQGPMLVLAGAGTGKTTVLVERIAFLIENQVARPEEVLAITFTENAAREMKERVSERLGHKAAITACTFHAYCLAVLKRSRQDFRVLPREDIYVFLRQRIECLQLERFIKPSDLGEFLHDLLIFFDRCHEELIDPEEFEKYVQSLRPGLGLPRNAKSKDLDLLDPDEVLRRWHEIARAYANAMRLLKEENLGTFGMLISGAVRLLRNDAELLHRERLGTQFILIDEFQDCNSSNITLAELLAGEGNNVFAVGDPDQAIYRFRGASSAAFEEFQRRFPETRGITLEENQRSRGNILRVAFAAISGNPDFPSMGKNVQFQRAQLRSGRDQRDADQGLLVFDDPVEMVVDPSEQDEAADIAEEILRSRNEQRSGPKDSTAVLYRTHAHRERVMEELSVRNIPFMVKGMDVLNTRSVRDLLGVAAAIADEGDIENLFRVCAFPQFAMDGAELRKKLAENRKSTLRGILRSMESGNLVVAALQASRSFVNEQQLGVAAALVYCAKQFGFPETALEVKAILRFAKEWEQKPTVRENTLPAFFEYLRFFQEAGGTVPLMSEEQLTKAARENPDAVQLMTIHGAKGLEFSHVWILRVVKGSFPVPFREPLFEFPSGLRTSIAAGESKEVNEQEERRLFYVAITRAKDRLSIHSRPGRGSDPAPIGFLRPLMRDRKLLGALRERETQDIPTVGSPPEASQLGSWLLMEPSFSTQDVSLSAYSVESYSTCPLKFKLERDWRLSGEAEAAMQFGSAMHTVLRQYYAPQEGQGMSVEDVLASFDREFGKAAIEDPVQRKLYQEMGARQLEALIEAHPRSGVDVLDTEISFGFMIGNHRIVGRIDRLDALPSNGMKLVRVVDYKTGMPRNQRFADESLQLSIYALGVAEMGYIPRELVLVNLQGPQQVATERSLSQLEKARYRVLEAAEGIAAGRFAPKPGIHCRSCEYERLCPATEQRVLIPIKELAEGVGA